MDYKTGLITAGVAGLTAIAYAKLRSKASCKIAKDLTGQVVIITGANTGIGKETTRVLAQMGATVILACRDQEKTRFVLEELKQGTKNDKIDFIRLDLSDLRSIKDFVEEFERKYQTLNILINNAGVGSVPTRKETKDGFELVFGTNHLGHFYLTTLLLDTLKRSTHSRVINVSSLMHKGCKMRWDDLMLEKSFNPIFTYSQSKLANVLFTKELQKRVVDSNIKVVALHPGTIHTELNRHFEEKWYFRIIFTAIINPAFGVFGKTRLQGAQTTLYCALEDYDKLQAGGYYSDCKIAIASGEACNEENAKKLWEVSEKLIAEKTRNF